MFCFFGGVVWVLLRCYLGVVSKKSIVSMNEEYFLTIILTNLPTEPFPELLPQLKMKEAPV